MNTKKFEALKLRQLGKSYREISSSLNIAQSTLFSWFKKESWEENIKINNIKNNIDKSKINIMKYNLNRKTQLETLYHQVENEAENEFLIYKNEPLFTGGLMLYAGEGDKNTRHLIRLSNSDMDLHKIFISFAVKYLKVENTKIKFSLILYPDLDPIQTLNIWSEKLNIDKKNFHKTQIIEGKSLNRRLQFGIGTSIIASTSLKKKVLLWLKLYKKEF